MTDKYLVTPALPYANGPAHLGHLVEHVQVNILVRALRMAGKEVLYVCGADSHGTPIEINAHKAKQKPEDFARHWQLEFDKIFKKFNIEFDGGFGTTHSKSNQNHAEIIFDKLKQKNLIYKNTIEQLYDPKLKRFLPDRMVQGTCPKCNAPEQYGDSCEACSRTYNTTDLLDPISVLSGETPILKSSEHYFVSLKEFADPLKDWMQKSNIISPDIQNYLKHWFNEGLKDWDISRDGPYFGFKIPGEENKYFYVWLDAPVGYISLSDHAAGLIGKSFSDYWQDPNTKIIHCIGKDIIYFHTLFWPAMLMAAEYTLPHKILVHGMLTVNGQKMSKSRGTFILADSFSKNINPEALRYYFACKLNNRIDDIDLNFDDLIARVNTDLVNKVVNIISRCLPLLHRVNQGKAADLDPGAQELVKKAQDLVESSKKLYLEFEFQKAMQEIIRCAESANKYLQDTEPWKLAKTDPKKAAQILTTGLFVGKICFGLLRPVLPKAVAKLEDLINNQQEFNFANITKLFDKDQIFKTYDHLFARIEESQVKNLLQESQDNQEQPISKSKPSTQAQKSTIQDFAKIELRAARVLSAQAVKDSDKLIDLKLDVGEFGQRQIFAGLRPQVTPETLVGKLVVLVANLEPRKMRFGISEGMMLACGEESPEPLFLHNAKPGERVR